MCGVFHIDVPPGNISLKALRQLQKNPMIASVIPLSLGDNLRGFRIVGSSREYVEHYGASVAQGRTWNGPMQVVVGSIVAKKLGIQVGNTFIGSHGLGAGGHSHGENPYTVVGVLQATGTVIDRLIVTDTASVWKVHEDYTALDDEDRKIMEDEREVTMALIQYKTPLAAMSFPRIVNSTTEMQAAAPAVEISRLLNMLGIGTDVLRAFAGVLLLTAGLSVFIALWSAVRERRSDLALLRMLGAPPGKIAALLLGEALWLGVLSAIIGVLAGQALTALIGWMLQLDNSLLIGGLVWPVELLWVPALACGVSLAAATLPAAGAYRVSVLELLQSR
jgi:putative ABC transport system permease protein